LLGIYSYIEAGFSAKELCLQVLINQLKEVAPSMQKSITQLNEEVNSISAGLNLMNNRPSWSTFPMQVQSSEKVVLSGLLTICHVKVKIPKSHKLKIDLFFCFPLLFLG